MLRTVAMRSEIWSGALQVLHQIRMSSSDGLRAPFSSLLTLVKCQPVKTARARPVRFASLRISRRRAPSASRAWWTGVGKSGRCVLAVRSGHWPRGLESSRALPDHVRVGGHLVSYDVAITRKMSEGDGLIIEQPEVIAWQQKCPRDPPR